MADSSDTGSTADHNSPKKRMKRLCKYRSEWEKEHDWLENVRDNAYKANCTVCRRNVSISHGGLADVKQHASGENHKRSERQRRSQGAMSQFLVRQATPEANMVTAAEVAHVYHTVKHNLSYSSADCALKLTLQTLGDSSIGKKISCGRTKAEALVTDVLSPKAVEEFFTPEKGIVNKLIDFVENPDESAESIVNSIRSSLENMGLTLDQVSAFSADNANVNYGIHNSVFTKLKKSNNEILRGNCHAHIVHNTVKHALDKLSVDVENIVLKIYSFFSTSAKRRECLKEFCVFCDVEFHEILRHVTTRWLSLNPAITRLLENWTPLKSYFISIGEECPRHLQVLLRLKEDAAGAEEEADLVEVYLLFCSNVLSLFEEVVKKLERDATTSVELYAIMDSFLNRLVKRRDDGFYGFLTGQKLRRLSPSDADLARQDFTAFLNTAISYVRKWFDFSDKNWLFHLQPLSLTSGQISYGDMENIIEQLHLVGRLNISMDELYDECITANSLLERLTGHQDWESKGTAERWVAVLRDQAADLPNILAVVSFVLSIPSSTGYVERVFSLMKNKWTDKMFEFYRSCW
ncbi:hypothetical protein SKAU_G00248820 [Synaphobranchus kaupii]|uniref:HAT C-terminal dimerisation domain-containing protein n=1 Tax=Synaphobranchus kaupii TaxID=118154 RepID=A0A9Q1F2E8_SYNKA|nr:hypothetical protein SKAU_G00248820 [Synaphobranchus kaupii]